LREKIGSTGSYCRCDGQKTFLKKVTHITSALKVGGAGPTKKSEKIWVVSLLCCLNTLNEEGALILKRSS
jgi:hypothetical protein